MTIQDTTQKVEGVINFLAPIAAATSPQAATAVAGVQAAEKVANAVEDNLAHHTAASDVAAGLSALASTPIVTGNPTYAAKVSGFALLFHDFLKMIGAEH